MLREKEKAEIGQNSLMFKARGQNSYKKITRKIWEN